MGAAQHTNVPLEAIGNLVRTVDSGGFLVAEFRDSGANPHSDEAKANATLFVAANELLEALTEAESALLALNADTSYSLPMALRNKMRAAIAKATGSAA